VTARPSFRRRLAVLCNSRSPSRPEPRSRLGLPTFEAGAPGTSLLAGSERSRTCRPGSMPESPIFGSGALGLIARPMARIACDGPRRHRYIRKRAICERCSCFSGTRSWKTVRYLGIEVDDALAISEQVEL
jgi:hypothetical protein